MARPVDGQIRLPAAVLARAHRRPPVEPVRPAPAPDPELDAELAWWGSPAPAEDADPVPVEP